MRFTKPVINIGIVGLGMGQTVFAAQAAPGSTVRVIALCDTDETRLAKVAGTHNIATLTTDFRDLLRRDDIDAIGIYTPDTLHTEQVLAALDAGKHVVCTKPMCTSLADARRILDAVRRTGLKFLVGQTCRFNPAAAAAKRLADEGKYGQVLYVEATYNHDMRGVLTATPWRYLTPQDLLFGGLCHPMDLAMWVGGRIRKVSAFAGRNKIDERYPDNLYTNFVVNLRFDSGAIGRVVGLYASVHPEGMPYIELTVCGTKAGSWQNKVTWHADEKNRRVEEITLHLPEAHEGVDYTGHGSEVVAYMRHFERCLREDTQPEPGALAATRVIAALEAVRESADTGRAVEVGWDF